jgi:BirA family transcriptional regulator, biotin operon repressor / biotin---[acetyl-CoA-carboxylase] ligase
MFQEHTVARATSAVGISAPPYLFDVVGSTNEELLRLAEQGAPDWTVVVANQQVAGRGRLGRRWVSLPGSSLLVSVLVRPPIPPAGAGLVSLASGACMALACSVASGVDARCKWPNDLLVGSRKLGGVLVEARVERDELIHVVIGTGVNVKQARSDFPPDLQGSATSVAMEGGRPDLDALLHDYLMRLRRFGDPSKAGFASTTLGLYRQVSETIGRRVRATTTDGRSIEGRASDIGPSGELHVETKTGLERVAFGEIEHLR